jgi:hypothetical protein
MTESSIGQNACRHIDDNSDMEAPNGVKLVTAERIKGGLMLFFDDDLAAFYSASLLRSILDQAEPVHPLEADEIPEDLSS